MIYFQEIELSGKKISGSYKRSNLLQKAGMTYCYWEMCFANLKVMIFSKFF